MWGIIGHESAVRLLAGAIARGRLAHAYLFGGPAQSGKRTLALAFARTLLCAQRVDQDGLSEPCGRCPHCRRILSGNHPDVRVVQPEEERQAITIDQAREVQAEAALRPYMAAWKMFIIRHMDRLRGAPSHEAAANCLLKTLEEPPEHTMFVLTADDPAAVLPTVRSRCQPVTLRPVPPQQIADALLARRIAPERAALLARLAAGRPGWALAAAEQASLLDERNQEMARIAELVTAGRLERLEQAGQLGKDAATARRALERWLSWWRDALLVAQGCPDLITNTDQAEPLQAVARSRRPEAIARFLARIQEAAVQIERNANPRLVWEVLLLDMPT
jgi:DNA polymerase-3 subunit delta'